MSIKLESLRCFCIVAQTGSLAEAADRLGRTQSAVSMSLKQLESHLGKRLFAGERKNQLSPLGERVFSLALNQLRQFDETIECIETAADAAEGFLRIASVPSVAALIFPGVLKEMTQRYPGLKLELRDTDTRQVIDSLGEGKADIGIASGNHILTGISAIALFEDRFGLCCAADHPLIQQAEAPCIEQIFSTSFAGNALCDLIDTPAFLSAMENVKITIHNNHSLINMIRTGHWVTVLPETVSRFIPESVAFRTISDLPDKRQVYLYCRDRVQFKELAAVCCSLIISYSEALQP